MESSTIDLDEATLDTVSGVAAGVFARKFLDSSLGDLSPDEAFQMTTDVSVNPGATAELLDIPVSDVDFIDPRAMRSKMMGMYLGQSAIDDLSSALNLEGATRSSLISRRRDAMMRHAKATPEQRERIAFDSANGDDSALTKVKEMFFFE